MNKVKYLIYVFVLTLGLASCEKELDIPSEVSLNLTDAFGKALFEIGFIEVADPAERGYEVRMVFLAGSRFSEEDFFCIQKMEDQQ